MAEIEPTTRIKGGRPDLVKLAKPTKYHPKGRVQLVDGEVVGPKNNVIRVNKKKITQDVGGVKIVLAEIDIPVNGGHVKSLNSVWRVGLYGPKKYHEKVLIDRELKERKGGVDHIAPELTKEEHEEYKKYLEFLAEKKVEIAENADFYEWLKK